MISRKFEFRPHSPPEIWSKMAFGTPRRLTWIWKTLRRILMIFWHIFQALSFYKVLQTIRIIMDWSSMVMPSDCSVHWHGYAVFSRWKVTRLGVRLRGEIMSIFGIQVCFRIDLWRIDLMYISWSFRHFWVFPSNVQSRFHSDSISIQIVFPCARLSRSVLIWLQYSILVKAIRLRD